MRNNEEEHLEKCLSSLVGVADEVIVVDSFSTDGTEAMCRKYNVTFIKKSSIFKSPVFFYALSQKPQLQ